MDHPLLAAAGTIKCNPDAPQRFVRALALERGLRVLVPTPRLRGGFRLLDPEEIPQGKRREAASLSKMDRWATEVALSELPPIDLVVTGSVAVTPEGRRCGKGEGYGDLEYAILLELGQDPPPVATTVHEAQVVEGFPAAEHDLPLRLIVTPERVIEVDRPQEPPAGIDWSLLGEEDLEEMPVLRELRPGGREA